MISKWDRSWHTAAPIPERVTVYKITGVTSGKRPFLISRQWIHITE